MMSGVCRCPGFVAVRGLSCLGFVVSDVCLSGVGRCPGFVVSDVGLSGVCRSTLFCYSNILIHGGRGGSGETAQEIRRREL